MSGTKIPDALAQLVAVFSGAGVDDVTVIDGPAFDPPDEFLAVGWDRSDQPAVTVTNERFDMPGSRGMETFNVSSLLTIAYDANTITEARRRLFVAFNAYSAALAANIAVPGVWVKAWIVSYDYTPSLAEVGTLMDLRFDTEIITVA